MRLSREQSRQAPLQTAQAKPVAMLSADSGGVCAESNTLTTKPEEGRHPLQQLDCAGIRASIYTETINTLKTVNSNNQADLAAWPSTLHQDAQTSSIL